MSRAREVLLDRVSFNERMNSERDYFSRPNEGQLSKSVSLSSC
jgi:hypothetical protein